MSGCRCGTEHRMPIWLAFGITLAAFVVTTTVLVSMLVSIWEAIL